MYYSKKRETLYRSPALTEAPDGSVRPACPDVWHAVRAWRELWQLRNDDLRGRNRKPTFRLPSLLKDVEQEFLQIKGPKPYPTGFEYSNHRSGRFIFWKMVVDIISSTEFNYIILILYTAVEAPRIMTHPAMADSQIAAFDRISSPGHIAVFVGHSNGIWVLDPWPQDFLGAWPAFRTPLK